VEVFVQERDEGRGLLLGSPQTDEQFPTEAGIIAGIELLHAAEEVRPNVGSFVRDAFNVRNLGTILGNADQLREHAFLLFHKPKLDERSQNINSN